MATGLSGSELLRMTGSMVLVLVCLGALLWMLRRMQAKIGSPLPGRRLQIIESLSLNTRHKVALVQVDGQCVLVGMSPAQLTPLAQWPQSPSVDGRAPTASVQAQPFLGNDVRA